MSDLHQRLRVALDQAERRVRAAGGDHPTWHVCDGWYSVLDDAGDVVVYDEGMPSGDQAEHIAAWDPARVLVLVDRDRALLDAYAVAARQRVPWNASAAGHAATTTTYSVLKAEVERAAMFWLNGSEASGA